MTRTREAINDQIAANIREVSDQTDAPEVTAYDATDIADLFRIADTLGVPAARLLAGVA